MPHRHDSCCWFRLKFEQMWSMTKRFFIDRICPNLSKLVTFVHVLRKHWRSSSHFNKHQSFMRLVWIHPFQLAPLVLNFKEIKMSQPSSSDFIDQYRSGNFGMKLGKLIIPKYQKWTKRSLYMSMLSLILTIFGQVTVSFNFNRNENSVLQKIYAGFAWTSAILWVIYAWVNMYHAFRFQQLEHPLRWLICKGCVDFFCKCLLMFDSPGSPIV